MRHTQILAATLLLALLLPACTSRRSLPGRAYAVLAGASGESEAENFFVADLAEFQEKLINRNWSVRTVLGNRAGMVAGSTVATNEEILRAVRETLEAAKAGDQVLLVFHSHGLESEKTWGQRSHSITTEDRDPLGTPLGFDLDVIEPFLETARTRGTRVALVDLSCYSGFTQRLQGAACTVTLAAPRYISLCSGREAEHRFTAKFFDLPSAATKISLEEQYLSARVEDEDSVNLPQISSLTTPALESWDSLLVEVDPLDTFEDLKELRAGTRPYDPRRLREELAPILHASAEAATLRRELEDRLGRLLSIRAQLEKALPKIAKEHEQTRLSLTLPAREPLEVSAGRLALLLETASAYEPKLAGFNHAQRNFMSALRANRTDVERQLGPALVKFKIKRDAFELLVGQLGQAAGDLMNVERQIYKAAARTRPGAEGCRNFAL